MSSIRLRALIASLGLLLLSVAWAAPAAAASDCPSGMTQFKIDEQPSDGTYSDGTLEVTISNADNDSFQWSSNITVDEVVVKGGPVTKSNPGGTSGSATSPDNPNNNQRYGISHVSFCYSTSGGGGGGGGGGGDGEEKSTETKGDNDTKEDGDHKDDKKCDANPDMPGNQPCTEGDTEKRTEECDANPEMAGVQPCEEDGKKKKRCDANPDMPGTQPCTEADTEARCDANPEMAGTQECTEAETDARCDANPEMAGTQECAEAETEECDANPLMAGIQPCEEVEADTQCDANPDMEGIQECSPEELAEWKARNGTAGDAGEDRVAGERIAGATARRGQVEEESGALAFTGGPSTLPFTLLAGALMMMGALLYRRGRVKE